MYWRVAAWWQQLEHSRWRLFFPPLLTLLSAVYRVLQSLDARWAQQHRRSAPLPVIAIGSVRVGGSGKTPLVRAIAQRLGWKTVIISRGYGSSCRRAQQVTRESGGSAIVGDEPWMLSGYATGNSKQPVIVAKERYEGAVLAAQLGFETALLDDALQHYRLRCNWQVGVLAAADLEEPLLPLGRLREPIEGLARCDWLLARDYQQWSPRQQEQLRQLGRPWSSFQLVSPCLESAPSGELVGWHHWKGRRVLALAAIARPDALFSLLRSRGLELVATWALADHQPIDPQSLLCWCQHYPDAEALICTEKDWARLDGAILQQIPVLWPQWEVEWQEGSELFFQAMEQAISTARLAGEAPRSLTQDSPLR